MAGKNSVARGVERKVSQDLTNSVGVLNGAQSPTIQFSTGNADALQRFSQNMFSFSARIEDRLDDEAEAEATTRGAADGSTGSFQPANYGTIRGRAYNAAAITSMTTTLDTQAIVKFSELKEKHRYDPAGFQREWGAYTDGVVKELAPVSPEQANIFKNRNTSRGVSGFEETKDHAYQMTISEAEASLARHQVAIDSEVKTLSADLFSQNGDRQRAAMGNLQRAKDEQMKIYRAKDPVSGRPLYTPEQIAKAEIHFNDKVMTDAALDWFEKQPDKAAAAQLFMDGEFKINVNVNNDHVPIIMNTQGKIRDKPLATTLQTQLRAAAAATGDGIGIAVHSAGQHSKAEAEKARRRGVVLKRTGAENHDDGHAADLRLTRDGKVLPFNENRELYAAFFGNAAAAGATGLGVDEAQGYLHIGGGGARIWGYRGKANSGDFVPADFAAAYSDGRKRKIETGSRSESFDMGSALSAAARDKLEGEMIQRVNFQNSQEDRRERKAQQVETKIQEQQSYNFAVRLTAPGQTDPLTGEKYAPVTEAEISKSVTLGYITGQRGEALINALRTPKPTASDEALQRELMRAMFNGEDIQDQIIANSGRLKIEDQMSLLTKNNSMNRDGGEGGPKMNDQQKFYLGNLKTALGDTGLMADMDMKRGSRLSAAYAEYYERVMDPDNTDPPRVIARDIAIRATNEEAESVGNDLQRLVVPRFGVMSGDGTYRLDLEKTKAAVQAAFNAKQITQSDLNRIIDDMMQWRDVMKQVDEADARANASQKKDRG